MARTTALLFALLLAFAAVPVATPVASATHICANATPLCNDPPMDLYVLCKVRVISKILCNR